MPGDGIDQPSTEGTGYDGQQLPQDEATRVMPADLESGSYVVMADPGNDESIYLGWDDEVDESSGVPLGPGTGLAIDMDNQTQNLWAYSGTTGDRVAYMATN